MMKSKEALKRMSEMKIDYIKLRNESYIIDIGSETAKLNGTYTIQRYTNPHPNLKEIVHNFCRGGESYYFPKNIYVEGNILYKLNEPNIEDMIDLIIQATYAENSPAYADESVRTEGPKYQRTKEVIYRYRGKLYILYDRYYFGYDETYVRFKNNRLEQLERNNAEEISDGVDDDELSSGDEYRRRHWDVREQYSSEDDGFVLQSSFEYSDIKFESDNEDDGDHKDLDVKLTRDEIILPTVPYYENNPLTYDYNLAFSIVDEASGVTDAFAIYR